MTLSKVKLIAYLEIVAIILHTASLTTCVVTAFSSSHLNDKLNENKKELQYAQGALHGFGFLLGITFGQFYATINLLYAANYNLMARLPGYKRNWHAWNIGYLIVGVIWWVMFGVPLCKHLNIPRYRSIVFPVSHVAIRVLLGRALLETGPIYHARYVPVD